MVVASTIHRNIHDLVELFESRPPIALAALARNTETLRNYKRVLHRHLIERICVHLFSGFADARRKAADTRNRLVPKLPELPTQAPNRPNLVRKWSVSAVNQI